MSTLAGERQEAAEEAVVREIALGLRCAVCQNQPVYESNSDLARDMLKVIREQVRAGRTPSEVRAYFHDRYGDYIYLEPTRQGSNLLLWVGPSLFLLVGVGVLGVALRRWRRPPSPPVAMPDVTTSSATTATERQKRIRQELERVEW
ncbi:MAG: cytochrome c-type biogenesis protein CcmH [Magnetococcales bacterium]|nr:cytochrome c-type biogenesis protein CcmH [Magnetococcales bacterium]